MGSNASFLGKAKSCLELCPLRQLCGSWAGGGDSDARNVSSLNKGTSNQRGDTYKRHGGKSADDLVIGKTDGEESQVIGRLLSPSVRRTGGSTGQGVFVSDKLSVSRQ